MTYIEFFEKDAIENICACFAQFPEKVIFIGNDSKLMDAHAERYMNLLERRGKRVEIVYKCVNRNNLQNIVDVIDGIVNEYEDCCFDLTGGEDLYLVAMGMIYEKYKDKNIQMHRFNILNGKIYDCDKDGRKISEEAPMLTVEENIRVYGGDIIYGNEADSSTYKWDLNSDFKKDIDTMWDICKRDVGLWNTQIGVFAAAESIGKNTMLTTAAHIPTLTNKLRSKKAEYRLFHSIIKPLCDKGLLISCDEAENEQTLTISFKNEQVKRCLTKAGQVLEMKIYTAALSAKEGNGKQSYNDVMNGVCIDWDGEIHIDKNASDTKNEIDVMMMHGMVPVFVSCKNGDLDADELYKLSTVAERFGGKYAIKALVATALDNNKNADSLRQRAKDMNIKIIENVQNMSDEELCKEMSFCKITEKK